MKTHRQLIAVALISAAAGALITALSSHLQTADSQTDREKQPLYWVAPMDPNYRRDQPGQSPMGMDLIPVYEEAVGDDYGPGVINISPDVVNNLGVRVAEVKRGLLHTQIKTVGYVKYDEDQLIHIHPRVEGWIEKLYVKAAGDPVTHQQPLYDLYSPQLVNAQEEYLLALSRNHRSLVRAAENRLRALQLSDTFIKQLKKQRQVQQTITFHSPQNGVVDNLNIREGFYVKPGTTLMSIGKLDQVWVEAEVFERQAEWVSAGLPVTMTLNYLHGRAWEGKVDYVYPTLDPKTRTARVRLRFENSDHALKPNMFAEVNIHADSAEEQLLIPREAVIRTGSQNRVVLALGDGRFKSIAVAIGAADEKHIAVTRGLKPDDKVVVSAQFLLDSESSKRSDFKRMSHSADKPPQSIWTAGNIHSLDQAARSGRIAHGEIPEWNRPAMTMQLRFADDIDISELTDGTELHMQLSQDENGAVIISAIHVMANTAEATSTEADSDADNPHANH